MVPEPHGHVDLSKWVIIVHCCAVELFFFCFVFVLFSPFAPSAFSHSKLVRGSAGVLMKSSVPASREASDGVMWCSDKNSIHLGRRCQSPRGVVDLRWPKTAMTSFVYWLIGAALVDGSAQSVCHLDSCCLAGEMWLFLQVWGVSVWSCYLLPHPSSACIHALIHAFMLS